MYEDIETQTEPENIGKPDYDIKMDGEFHTFAGGAIRYTKTGKGRFDLIPWKVISNLIRDWKRDTGIYDNHELLEWVAEQSPDFIIRSIIAVRYGDGRLTESAIAKMLLNLAIHYEKGAEKYGVDNWKKGIPKESFWDSGCRHTMQFIAGKTDEPHHISAIWNFIGYIWTEETERK